MSRPHRIAILIGIATTVGSLTPPGVAAQGHPGRTSLSRAAGPGGVGLRDEDALIERMIRDRDLVLQAAYDDPALPGRRHERFRQYFGGVPVRGGDVSRQSANAVTVSIVGVLYSGIDIELTPGLSEEAATTALEALSGTAVMPGGGPNLTIMPTLDGAYALAYHGTMRNAVTYYIDAHSGRVLQEVNARVHTSEVGNGRGALGDTKKVSANRVAGTFRAQDQLRPAEIQTLDPRGSEANLERMLLGTAFDSDIATDGDNDWTAGPVVDTHVHTGWSYDYFSQQQGWDALDNQNSRIFAATANASVLPDNAFFVRAPFGPEGRGMLAFGATSSQGDPVTALDVAAHEFMHGVTFFSVNQGTGNPNGLDDFFYFDDIGPENILLSGGPVPCGGATFEGLPLYCRGNRFALASNHSGALNEGFSDIFGTAAEFFHQPPGSGALQADYLMGEDVSIGPLRSLRAPGSQTAVAGVPYPAHLARRLTFAVVITAGTQASPTGLQLVPLIFTDSLGNYQVLGGTDAGGVHWNATIIGNAYYLAVEGGQNQTSGLSVQGVGAAQREQVESVFFRAMTQLMPSGPSWSLAASTICQAAVDLFGHNSAVTRAVDEALYAVGLRPAPAGQWCRAL